MKMGSTAASAGEAYFIDKISGHSYLVSPINYSQNQAQSHKDVKFVAELASWSIMSYIKFLTWQLTKWALSHMSDEAAFM